MEWKTLIGVLSEEKEVFEELIELAGQKKDAVYQKDLEQLDAVVRREQGAVMRLGHWEKQRLSCLDALKDRPGSETLLFFAEMAPPAEKETLLTLHEQLSNLIQTLKKLNAENKALTESRLEYVRFVLDVLSEDQMTGVYGAGGVSPAGKEAPKKILDKTV